MSLFVTEALILTVAGGIGGLLVAGWAGPLGTLAFQSQVPVEVEISPSVLGYAVLLCALVGLVVGLVPGLQASRPDLVSALKDVTVPGFRRQRLAALFVIVQIAISFVLLHSTGLLTRSLVTLTEAPSAEPANIATLRLQPRLVGYRPEQGEAVVREVHRLIEALPGGTLSGVRQTPAPEARIQDGRGSPRRRTELWRANPNDWAAAGRAPDSRSPRPFPVAGAAISIDATPPTPRRSCSSTRPWPTACGRTRTRSASASSCSRKLMK